jgi:hypothetical protein
MIINDMNKVVEILMSRDGMPQDHAERLVQETRDEIMMLDNPLEADDVLMDYLGLEPDYLEDVLNF